MVTAEKFKSNFKLLQEKLPAKPSVYTSIYPTSIREALLYYCNRRTVHGLQANTYQINKHHWPLPLWFDRDNIRVGFFNKLYYKRQFNSWDKKVKFKGFDYFHVFSVFPLNNIMWGIPFSTSIIEAFNANKNYAFRKLKSYHVLEGKDAIIGSMQSSFRRGDWIAFISTTLPMVDYLIRRFLHTNNLSVNVNHICRLFEKEGISSDNTHDLMPFMGTILKESETEEMPKLHDESFFKKIDRYDLGIIGPALSSFVHFANLYYRHYRENDSESDEINRHAILHGAITKFGTEENAIKLVSFLFLILELEPVFDILLEP